MICQLFTICCLFMYPSFVVFAVGFIWFMSNGLIYIQEEETKSWKKLINVAVSGAAGMISNHLLFKVSNRNSFSLSLF